MTSVGRDDVNVGVVSITLLLEFERQNYAGFLGNHVFLHFASIGL